MITSKPFSTISYNTEIFLKQCLDAKVKKGEIDFYAFIKHYAEDDEKKDHIHLFIIPASKIDCNSLKKDFDEIDPKYPLEKPLGIKPCFKSRFSDWYLYTIHDATYLATKGQTRRYHYKQTDFITSDDDELLEFIHQIDWSKYNKNQIVLDCIEKGMTFSKMLRLGLVPIQQVYQYQKMYELLSTGSKTFRNGRDGHEDVVDMESGEIIEERQCDEKQGSSDIDI